jgi:hypothetical protein
MRDLEGRRESVGKMGVLSTDDGRVVPFEELCEVRIEDREDRNRGEVSLADVEVLVVVVVVVEFVTAAIAEVEEGEKVIEEGVFVGILSGRGGEEFLL